MTEYVVIAMAPVDTAVINAESEQDAILKYELPDDVPKDKDILLYAVTAEEFYDTLNPEKDQ